MTLTLLSKWGTRCGAIPRAVSQPQTRPRPTRHPSWGLQGPLQSPEVPSQRTRGSPGHLPFKTFHMNLLDIQAGAASVSSSVPVNAMPVYTDGSWWGQEMPYRVKKNVEPSLFSCYLLVVCLGGFDSKERIKIVSC